MASNCGSTAICKQYMPPSPFLWTRFCDTGGQISMALNLTFQGYSRSYSLVHWDFPYMTSSLCLVASDVFLARLSCHTQLLFLSFLSEEKTSDASLPTLTQKAIIVFNMWWSLPFGPVKIEVEWCNIDIFGSETHTHMGINKPRHTSASL